MLNDHLVENKDEIEDGTGSKVQVRRQGQKWSFLDAFRSRFIPFSSWSPRGKRLAVIGGIAFLVGLAAVCLLRLPTTKTGGKQGPASTHTANQFEIELEGAQLTGWVVDFQSEDARNVAQFLIVHDFPSNGYNSFTVQDGLYQSYLGVCRDACDAESNYDNALYKVSYRTIYGVDVDFSIDGVSYDLSEGRAFLLSTRSGSPVGVQQVTVDASSYDFSYYPVDAAVQTLAEQSDAIVAFAQAVAAYDDNAGNAGNRA